MTDRELLEAAAKAAGLRVRSDSRSTWIVEDDGSPERRWNPLTDDGAALRLAVKLRMSVDFYGVTDQLVEANVQGHSACGHGESRIGADAAAATRRAIVCAAAAMAPT